jgi:hypothetical protein
MRGIFKSRCFVFLKSQKNSSKHHVSEASFFENLKLIVFNQSINQSITPLHYKFEITYITVHCFNIFYSPLINVLISVLTMTSFAAVLTTWMVLASSGAAVEAVDYMTTPLDYGVYEGGSQCAVDSQIGTGTVTYLAPLPNAEGSFCENSISQVPDENGDMLDITIYTKINIVSCDALEMTGMVFVDVYLCFDSVCGDCQDNLEPSKAQLILPSFDPLPAVDDCWGISSPSTLRTTLQQFATDVDIDAAGMYWTIFNDNSCIGDINVDESSSSSNTTSTADADVVEVDKMSDASVSGAVTTTTFFSATLAMVLLIVGSI